MASEINARMMANENKEFSSVYDEPKGSRFVEKAKKNPFVPAGIMGGLGALFYSAYKFRTRPADQKLSVYLIHTRVAAQGAVVSALTIGVAIQMYREFFCGEAPQSSIQQRSQRP